MRARVSVWVVVFLVLVTGCDKAASIVTSDKYKNLQRFVGKGPNALLADPQIGHVIAGLVPEPLNTCMDDVFNYAPDIERLDNGTIRTSANGSRVDSQRVGYVSVEPSGRIDVILWCDHNRDYYFWYSTAPLEKNASPDLIAWARLVGSGNGPPLRRFGTRYVQNFGYESIQKGQLASATSEKEDEEKARKAPKVAAQSQHAQGTFVRAGAVMCVNVKSFYKVNAIEMTGNNYVSLPGDCDYVGSAIAVNVLRQFSDPVVGGIAVVGNAGGSAFVRIKDLSGE